MLDTTDHNNLSEPRVVFIQPTEALPSGPEQSPARFLGHLRRQQMGRIWVLRGLALLIAMSIVGFCFAISTMAGALVDAAQTEHAAPISMTWVAVAAVAVLLRFLLQGARDHLGQQISLLVRLALRSAVMKRIRALGPVRLLWHGNEAWWSQRLGDEIDALHGYLARYLSARESAVIIPLAIATVVLLIDWIAGLLLLLALPIIPAFMALIGLGTQSVHETQQEEQARLAAHLQERLDALPWLARLGALAQTRASVHEAAHRYRQVAMRVLRVAFLSSAVLEFFSAVAIGVLAIYIGFALVGLFSFGPAGDLTFAAGLFILLLAPEAFAPLRQLAQTHHDLKAAQAAAAILGRLPTVPVSEQAESASAPGKTELAHNGLLLRMREIRYSPPGASQPLLNALSLEIRPGEVLGVAGPSGSGKSTLLAIAAGHLEPAAGEVLRPQQSAWVAQRPHLFHGSLRDNLALASREQPNDATLLAALSAAGLPLPDPSLALGLDTPIGDALAGVSGGQAQRIAIARGLLQDAQVLLLDEPTAALDADTRDQLLDTLFALVRQRQLGVLLASHDPKVLARCDRIITLGA